MTANFIAHAHVLNKRFISGIALLLFSILLISLYHRYIQQDEPWFGEQAYWLLKEGQVKLKSMPGMFNWDSHMLIYHKLFVWIGAIIISVFGWSLYLFKTFIFLSYIGTLYFVRRYLLKVENGASLLFWYTILVLITIPELIHRSFMFRPEVLIMFFGFLSFYFTSVGLKSEKTYAIILSGLFAGLAFLTHLNALLFPVVGFLFLLFNKKWKALIYYSIVCFGVCLFYTHELWNEANIETFLYQLKHWPTHQETFGEKVDGGIFMAVWNNILRVLNEHKRYFWDQDVWGISTLFLLTLIAQFKYLWNNYKSLTLYTLLLMFFLAVLSSSHGARYLVYLMPFMSIIIGLGVYRVMENVGFKLLKGVYGLMFLAQFIFVVLTYNSIFKKNYDHVEEHEKYLSKVEKGARVLGSWEFIYNEIDQYHIFSFKTYEYIEDREQIELTQQLLLEKAALDFKMDYIILNEERKNSKEFPWFKNWEIVPNSYYKEVFRDEKYLILRRQNSSG